MSNPFQTGRSFALGLFFVASLCTCDATQGSALAELPHAHFYYGFLYYDLPPAGAALLVRAGTSCRDSTNQLDLQFSSVYAGTYPLVARVEPLATLNGSRVADAVIQVAAVGDYALRTGAQESVVLLDAPGDGVTVDRRPLRARATFSLSKRAFATYKCFLFEDSDGQQMPGSCSCKAADGEEKTCVIDDAAMKTCCHLFDSVERETVEFMIEARYCPNLCADLGTGINEKWCPKPAWSPS